MSLNKPLKIFFIVSFLFIAGVIMVNAGVFIDKGTTGWDELFERKWNVSHDINGSINATTNATFNENVFIYKNLTVLGNISANYGSFVYLTSSGYYIDGVDITTLFTSFNLENVTNNTVAPQQLEDNLTSLNASINAAGWTVFNLGNVTNDTIGFDEFDNRSIVRVNTTIVGWINSTDNITTSGYYYGQPLDGSIGGGIIYASSFKVKCGCIDIVDAGGLDATYPDMIVRIADTSLNVKYCVIPSATTTLEDNNSYVYWVDSDCKIQNNTWDTYFDKALSLGNYVRIFGAKAYDGDIEVLKGASLISLTDVKTQRVHIETSHLTVVDGMTLEEGIFPYYNITSGFYQYINTIVTSQKRESENNGTHLITYSNSNTLHINDSGINLSRCTDGTSNIACPSNAYRRYLIGIEGWGDHTKIHQFVPHTSDETYALLQGVDGCMNLGTNPLVFNNLASTEVNDFVKLYVYCGKRDDTDWREGWIRVEAGGGIAGTVDTSNLLSKEITFSGDVSGLYNALIGWTMANTTLYLGEDGNASLLRTVNISKDLALVFNMFNLENVSNNTLTLGDFETYMINAFRLENVSNVTPWEQIINAPEFSNFKLENVSNTTAWENIINAPAYSAFTLENVTNDTIGQQELIDFNASLPYTTFNLGNVSNNTLLPFIEINSSIIYSWNESWLGLLVINRTLDEIGDEANSSLIAYIDSKAGADATALHNNTDANFSSVNVQGLVNATKLNGTLDCTMIGGGSDVDFCVDADSGGEDSTEFWELENFTSAYDARTDRFGLGNVSNDTIGQQELIDFNASLPYTTFNLGNVSNNTLLPFIEINSSIIYSWNESWLGLLVINRTLDEIGDEANSSLINYIIDVNTSMLAYLDNGTYNKSIDLSGYISDASSYQKITDIYDDDNASHSFGNRTGDNLSYEGGKLWINKSFLTSFTEADPIASTYEINRTLDEIGDEANSSLLTYINTKINYSIMNDSNISMKTYVDSVASNTQATTEQIYGNFTNTSTINVTFNVEGIELHLNISTDLCELLTGSSALCDGDDATAAGGMSDTTHHYTNITSYLGDDDNASLIRLDNVSTYLATVFSKFNLANVTNDTIGINEFDNDTIVRLNISNVGNLNITYNFSVDTKTFFVDENRNRIGIGTCEPKSELEIRGSAPIITVNSTNDLSGLRLNILGGGNELFRVQDKGSTKLVIDDEGNVGIGATSPDGILDLSTSGSPTLYVQTTAASGTQANIYLTGARTAADADLATIDFFNNEAADDGAANARILVEKGASVDSATFNFLTRQNTGSSLTSGLFIQENGQVGIGGDHDPTEPLVVKTDSGGEAIAIEESSGGEQWQLGVDAAGDLNFQNSGAVKVHFNDNSDVKIYDGALCVERGGSSCAGTTGGYIYCDDVIEYTSQYDAVLYGPAIDEIMKHEGVMVDGVMEPNYSTFTEGIVKKTGYEFPDHINEKFDDSLMTETEFYNSLTEEEKAEVTVGQGISLGGRAAQNEQAIKELYDLIQAQQAQIDDLQARIAELEKAKIG